MSWPARADLSLLALAASLLAGCGNDASQPARVTIPTHATMRVAAESLRAHNLVGSARLFALYAKARGYDRTIKAGTYLLSPDASWNSLLASLRDGRGVMNVVTVPEGYTLAQIERLLAARLGVPPDSLRAAARDTALLRALDVPTAMLEGYLFPNTYFFAPGTSARVIVATMVREFEQRWLPAWTARLDSLALSRHDVVTLASIVEREAKLPEERPVIAAVYWNRLRRGMLLQADPTVQYALPEYQRRLLNRHLEVRSPYNTYKNRGLPPGPIGAPGIAALQATLYPADVPYLYFVAYPDGHHEFRVKLADHQAAARLARRAWTQIERAARSAKPALPGTPAPPRPGRPATPG